MRELLGDLNLKFETDVPLGPHTWYEVGGKAAVLAHPSSTQQLAALLARCHQHQVPTYILGAGANLLVDDAGVNGVVIKLDAPQFAELRIEGRIVTVGAGHDLMKLVRETAKQGLSGLEPLAGVPATVGGAVRMNAGGAYGDIGRVVRRIEVLDATGHVYYRDRDDLVFGYRKTNIVGKCITHVEFELTPGDADECMAQVKKIYAYKSAVQPLGARSAGCAFKNPPPEAGASAGQLLDRAGLKGYRDGGAEVSTVHANFIVAHPGCSARDIVRVMEHMQKTVQEKFGVTLEREVVVWGA